MARGGAHYEEAKAHTLNNAGDQKSSGDHRRIKTQRAKGRRKVSVRPPCCQLAYSSTVPVSIFWERNLPKTAQSDYYLAIVFPLEP
jgi:hypothetical protein